MDCGDPPQSPARPNGDSPGATAKERPTNPANFAPAAAESEALMSRCARGMVETRTQLSQFGVRCSLGKINLPLVVPPVRSETKRFEFSKPRQLTPEVK